MTLTPMVRRRRYPGPADNNPYWRSWPGWRFIPTTTLRRELNLRYDWGERPSAGTA